jgi:hypothetical protein
MARIGSTSGMKLVVWIALRMPKRRAASIASQQQPQQLQMKLTPLCMFSPNWTSQWPRASSSSSRHSVASIVRATPWRVSDSATVLNVMQMFIGASQARSM